MKPELWPQVERIFQRALELDESRRSEFVQHSCGEDEQLRQEVESLLSQDKKAGQFIDEPALEFVGRLIANNQDEVKLTDNSSTLDLAGTAGTAIGRYQLLQKVGEGGMGEVWLAEQKEPVRRRVALKLVKAGMNTREVMLRFESERQALALMDHPAIAKVFDAGSTTQGAPYFVMEYVAGVPITAYCDNHRLNIRERLELFIHVCEGVQHAHQKAIIHRDLKPSNILVLEVDGRPAPKIIDFGVAKALTQGLTEETMFTRAGSLVGTLEYMSPEQAHSSGGDIDTRTDVYSLGVVLYILLAGSLPFDTKEWKNKPLYEMLRRLREEDPPRPSTKLSTDHNTPSATAEARGTEPRELVSVLRGDLDCITLKAVEKDRTRRYGTPSDLAADIGRYLKHEPISARPDTIAYRIAKFVRRNRLGVGVGTLAMAAVLAASGMAMYQARVSQRRFQDVRKLAHTFVFELHDEIAKLEGSTKAREMMVQTGLEYLDNLSRSAGRDLELQKEIAAAYMKVGDAQGFPTKPNLGRTADALLSYQKAGDIYRKISAKNPAYLPDLANYYLAYAGLVRFTDLKQARNIAEMAIKTLEQARSQRPLDDNLELAYGHAWCTLGDMDEDMDHYRDTWTEISRCSTIAHASVEKTRNRETLSLLSAADERVGTSARNVGLLDDALRALDEDESVLKELLITEPQNPRLHRQLALVDEFRAEVYYNDESPSLGDAALALKSAQRYLEIARQMARSDPANRSAKFSEAVALLNMSFPLREFDAPAAVRMTEESVRIFDEMIASGKTSYLVSSRRVRALIGLGQAQLKAGLFAEARRTAQMALKYERALAIPTGDDLEEHTVWIQALSLAGHAEVANGELRPGESLLLQARDEAAHSAASNELADLVLLTNTEKDLGDFYVSRARTNEARSCYRRLVQLWEQFPDNNYYVARQRMGSKQLLASLP
jgi:serine/threonine protein kinase/tetratricopeptide (TPR) repeat protein